MPRVRITLVTDFGTTHTIEATRMPPIEFEIETQRIVPFMQSLTRLTQTPDLLVAAIVAMDTAVNLTREEAEHP